MIDAFTDLTNNKCNNIGDKAHLQWKKITTNFDNEKTKIDKILMNWLWIVSKKKRKGERVLRIFFVAMVFSCWFFYEIIRSLWLWDRFLHRFLFVHKFIVGGENALNNLNLFRLCFVKLFFFCFALLCVFCFNCFYRLFKKETST